MVCLNVDKKETGLNIRLLLKCPQNQELNSSKTPNFDLCRERLSKEQVAQAGSINHKGLEAHPSKIYVSTT